MKNVNELRIPAYAVVEITTKKTMELVDNRDTARGYLQEYKAANPEYKFKLVKLQASKFIR